MLLQARSACCFKMKSKIEIVETVMPASRAGYGGSRIEFSQLSRDPKLHHENDVVGSIYQVWIKERCLLNRIESLEVDISS